MYVVQVDIKTAFLNGDLKDYVSVFPSRVIPGLKLGCFKLQKAIHVLKKAHVTWHTKFSTDTKGKVFEELRSSPCVFRRKLTINTYAYILVYIGDLLIYTQRGEGSQGIVGPKSWKSC